MDIMPQYPLRRQGWMIAANLLLKLKVKTKLLLLFINGSKKIFRRPIFVTSH
jgi:hypothetical protein